MTRITRRNFIKAAVGAAAITAVGAKALTGRSSPMKLGAYTGTNQGESAQQATMRYEALVNDKSAYGRSYVGLDSPLTGSFMTWCAGRGMTNIISIHSRINTDHAVPWQDVANGLWDSQLTARANELKSYPGFAYLIWHHEPENDANQWWSPGGPDQDAPSGDPADYVAAGLRVRKVFRDAGCGPDRAIFGQCLMAGTYGNGHGGYDQWKLPFGILAVDGYDRSATKSFSQLFTDAHNVATSLGTPLLVEETGTVEDPSDPQAKAAWFNAAAATSWPELVGVCYTNKNPYPVDSSTNALNAYKAWAAASA